MDTIRIFEKVPGCGDSLLTVPNASESFVAEEAANRAVLEISIKYGWELRASSQPDIITITSHFSGRGHALRQGTGKAAMAVCKIGDIAR
jgi:hypothetical protein